MATSVSSKVHILVLGGDVGFSKQEAAKKHGCAMINEAQLLEVLEGGKLFSDFIGVVNFETMDLHLNSSKTLHGGGKKTPDQSFRDKTKKKDEGGEDIKPKAKAKKKPQAPKEEAPAAKVKKEAPAKKKPAPKKKPATKAKSSKAKKAPAAKKKAPVKKAPARKKATPVATTVMRRQ
ncbi:hypothetical protein TrST_g1688 [Triparma strigata]|uniref:Uncharacterized protein n=1 Tax=Triparma strigata TaxID=1606541 RepID=A0A9W6ZMC2_9STRA|nr:hypothetical protein TrST_g1688 [Triparma strigata]